jgi:hypothetical protein
MITKKHLGVNFFAENENQLNKKIEDYDFERSIFYKSSVYTYSCIARQLDNDTIEFIQYFNNGQSKSISYFKNKDDFYKKISY